MPPTHLPRPTAPTTSPTRTHSLIHHLTIPRRLRRHGILILPILVTIWFTWLYYLNPIWQERRMLDGLLDRAAAHSLGGGGNMRPEFRDLVFLEQLDPALLPGLEPGQEKRRLVFVGDVHGCLEELERLLQVVEFDETRDHLLAVGDVVKKGPDSAGVVDLLMRLNASCVRGNHEDRMLLERAAASFTSAALDNLTLKNDAASPPNKTSKKQPLYTQFTARQLEWLSSRPVILHVGTIAGQTYVLVHAGLAPTVPLDRQDPFQVMNMRSIHKASLLPSEDRNAGSPWDAVWNRAMSRLVESISATASPTAKLKEGIEAPLTVVYGHDAKKGLSIRPYSKGLDSGCVGGGRLTAFVVDASGRMRVFGINCKDHLSKGEDGEESKGSKEDDKAKRKAKKRAKK